MNESRQALKVGIFVAVALALTVTLVMMFSKGFSLFASTYTLNLRATTVAGLKTQSGVQLAGLDVGRVIGTDLTDQGRGVIIRVKIDREYPIYSDARFVIEQVGFLGDQFIAIYPGKNQGHILKDGETVECEEPFNIGQVARSAVGFIQRMDATIGMVNDAINRVSTILLNEQTLTNFALAAVDFRALCASGREVMDGLNAVVRTNASPVALAVSNMVSFSEGLDRLAEDLRQVVVENRRDLTNVVHHLQTASASVADLAKDMQAGRGIGGALFRDEHARTNFTVTLANFSSLSSNLVFLSSNLNRYGLLYKPKPPKKSEKPIYPGRSPFN